MVRRFAVALVAAGLLLGAGSARAADKVTIAALAFISSSPLFIAQEKGYYADEGLEVEFKFFRAAQPVAVAIASGDADFGVTAFTAGFFNLAGKGALKVIGNRIFVTAGRELWAFSFSENTLKPAWEEPWAGPADLTAPAVADGVIYVGTAVGVFFALDSESGEVISPVAVLIGSPKACFTSSKSESRSGEK